MPKKTAPKGRTTRAIGFSGTDQLLAEIDAAAAAEGYNRSQFIVQAVREKLLRIKRPRSDAPVTR